MKTYSDYWIRLANHALLINWMEVAGDSMIGPKFTLHSTPPLTRQKLNHRGMIGFCDGNFRYHLPVKYSRISREIRKQCYL